MAGMAKKSIDKICQRVYRRYPQLGKKRPKISSRPGDKFLLVFENSGKTPDGKTIKTRVRVVANENGKIIKMSSSR